MRVFTSIDDFHSKRETIVTIGTFDGVHIGHRKIISRIVNHPDAESVILTFFPHPRMVLKSSAEITLLNTIEEKSDLIQDCGVDNLIVHPFDHSFSKLTAEKFVAEILVGQLNLQKIVIGHDHRFGVNRTAGIDDLIKFGKQFNFEVEQIPVQEIDEMSVSSTKIRAALVNGEIDLANSFLGYEYFLTGTVVKGNQLGRTIGFPTANILISDDYKLVPGNGVYVVYSQIAGAKVYGMMNIGVKPTIGGNTRSIEVYYFDFNDNLYDATLRVHIISRIRDERKFDSVELLRKQLADDEVAARKTLLP